MISAFLRKHSFDVVFDSQQVYRLLLEAVSNPARIVSIREYADKLFGGHPAFLAVAMTLMDNEVSFTTCSNQPLAEEIVSLTLAMKETTERADFVFVCDPHDLNDLKNIMRKVKSGTLADPHRSATVIIRNDGVPACPLKLSGPGIDGHTTVSVTQRVKDAIALRKNRSDEYPQGIDLIFVSSGGELLAVPRLVGDG
ncbi:MAG: phosphonate C-P lyase system protein PhnH [Peptococcaceae bacterium]|nr:phosphonate C-P lyase system protein PhnH [Peptococcaceae bacterium]